MLLQKSGLKYFLIFIFSLALASGCVRKPTSTAEVPRSISAAYKISVAPFTQPRNGGELITGQIPEEQGIIPQDALLALDRDLRETLMTRTKRQYNFIPGGNMRDDLNLSHTTSQPSGLPRWLEYGRKHGAQLLLVPQIINWHEREGSQAGVTKSAHVRVEFYLLNIPQNNMANRSIFEEKQVGLTENFLSVGDFFKRKGQWVSAGQLTVEGMLKAIKDMGL